MAKFRQIWSHCLIANLSKLKIIIEKPTYLLPDCRRYLLPQCDQMVIIVFIICQFASMKNCPIVYKISRSK